MSESDGRINRGLALKLTGVAATAVVAEILAERPADANLLPINMNANGGGSGAAIKIPPGAHCPEPPYENVYIWMWDYEDRSDAPKQSDKTWLILFDNRPKNKKGVKLGGTLSGYYGNQNFDEDQLSGHHSHNHGNLKIVVAAKLT